MALSLGEVPRRDGESSRINIKNVGKVSRRLYFRCDALSTFAYQGGSSPRLPFQPRARMTFITFRRILFEILGFRFLRENNISYKSSYYCLQ